MIINSSLRGYMTQLNIEGVETMIGLLHMDTDHGPPLARHWHCFTCRGCVWRLCVSRLPFDTCKLRGPDIEIKSIAWKLEHLNSLL
jgi:hypothetical protein